MFTIIVAACVLGLGPDEEQAYRAELLADARERTSFLSDGFDVPSGGHGERGFFITDGGPNTLVLGGNIRFRYIANFRSNTTSPDSSYTGGFAFRSLRLAFSGSVLSPRLTYMFQLGLQRGDDAVLDEAHIDYALTETTSLRFGQFKLPFFLEESTSLQRLQAVERSTTDAVFGQGYSEGVSLRSTLGDFRLHGAFSDGLGSLNTPYAAAGTEVDYALTGRAEFKWAGQWKQLDQFASWRSAPRAGFLGAAVHFQDGGQTSAPYSTAGVTHDASTLSYTSDVSIKGPGWNVFLAGVGRHTDDDVTGTQSDDFGAVASAGVFVTDNVECFARYSGVYADEDRANGDAWNEYTIGFNNYFVPESHAAKFTLDLTWMPEAQSESSALVQPSVNNTNLLASEGSQFMIRAQMQLVF